MLFLSSLRLGFRALVRTSSLVVASAAALIGQTPSANDGFDPNLNGPVFAAVTQRDGKVIVGGAFTTVLPNGASDRIDRVNFARFNSNGTLDLEFNPSPNGHVTAIALQPDGSIIIGGFFTQVQPNNSNPAPAALRNRLARILPDGRVDPTFNPDVGGAGAPQVTSIVVQADGRIVIGGTFRSVGGVARNYLARLLASGAVDTSFNPNPNAAVLSLALYGDGNKILVGGSFTSLSPENGVTTNRTRFARLNPNGTPDSEFDAKPDNAVTTIAVQTDGKIILGGSFNAIVPSGSTATTTRSRLARLNADGSLDTAWNPNPNADVNALLLQPDGTLLVGGAFTSLRPNNDAGSTSRPYLARLLVDGSLDVTFNSSGNGAVQALALQADGKVIAGGYFTQYRAGATIAPVNRNYLARLNADGSVDTTLDPTSNGRIVVQAVQSDGKVIVGGNFSILGGVTRNFLARLNANGTVDTTFAPVANDIVNAIVVQANGQIVIGGAFTNVSGIPRRYLARLNSDGSVDAAFDPAPNAQITALALQSADQKIVVGGAFTALQPNGTSATTNRGFIARLNPNGTLDSFDPGANSSPTVITVLSDGKILIGGNFTFFTPNAGTSSTGRAYSARLNSDGTVDTSWDTGINGNVLTHVVQSDGKIVVAGAFNTVAPKGAASLTVRYFIARFNADGTVDTAYDPRASDQINTLALQSDGKIVAGGLFSFFRNQDDLTKNVNINRIARLNTDGSVDTAFNPNGGGQVNAITVLASGQMIVSGGFNALTPAGQGLVLAPNRIVRLNSNGTVDGAFDPAATPATGQITTLAVQPDSRLLVGGSFTNFAGATSRNLARFTLGGAADTNFNPNPDGPVSALIVQPARGNAAVQTANFGWFERNSALRASFNHFGVRQLIGEIRAVLVQPDGKIIIAGAFTNQTGLTNSNLARLTPDGEFDSSYKPLINGSVFALALQADGKLILAGSFDQVNSTARGRIARLNADGSLDTAYDPTASADVRALALQADGKLVLGGDFTTLQPGATGTAVGRNYIARLNTDGTIDTPYNPTANAAVNALVFQSDGKLLVGGSFTSLQPGATGTAVNRSNMARLNADGTVDSYNPGPNAVVNAIAIQPADGKAVIGGAFNGVRPDDQAVYARAGIARLNVDGTLDSNFDPSANGAVNALAAFADGTILVGGDFTTFRPNGAAFATTRTRLALINSDGGLNPGFNPGPTGTVFAVRALADGSLLAGGRFNGIQGDGSLLVGGNFATIGGSQNANLAFLDGDGNASPFFTPNPNGLVAALAQQADTRLIVGGNFTSIAGLPRARLARLTLAGVIDTTFNPGVDGLVSTLAVQVDGRILLGGTFANVAGTARANLARLTAAGAIDAAFTAVTNGSVFALQLLPDGKILIAGSFTTVSGTARNRLARLNADGSVDTTFTASVGNGEVRSLALAADGKISLAGTFSTVSGAPRANVARLNADGSLDAAFNSATNGTVFAAILQGDGAPVIGGTFSTAGGLSRVNLARLAATTPATQAIVAAANRTSVTWNRGGGSPDVSAVRFEFSTDSANWTAIGTATRVGTTANWQLTGLNLPAADTFYIRASGATAGLLRAVQAFNFSVVPAFNSANSVGTTSGNQFLLATGTGATAAYAAEGLPPGLALNSDTGVISGIATTAGTYGVTVTATNAGGTIARALSITVSPPGSTSVGPAILYNLASRATIAGSGLTTSGFSVSGPGNKSVLIRASGPTLAAFGVTDGIARPRLRLLNAVGAVVLENAGWANNSEVAATAARLGAFAYAAGSVDAAVVVSLAPGNYSVQVGDDAARGGSVLTEIYTAESVATATLINLAARAPVAVGRPLIGGFVVTGEAGTVQRLLLRGVGPGLAKFGLTGALGDPVIKVYNSAGALVASNDDWSGADLAALAPFALDAGSKDAALIYSFSPGAYTLEVSTTGTAGEALAEIYSAP